MDEYKGGTPESKQSCLAYLGLSDCPCAYEWRSLGRLYGISMGNGWVRMTTEASCRHHGSADPRKPT